MPAPGTMLSVDSGHSERVSDLSWSSDGTVVIASGNDVWQVHIWAAP